MPIDIRRAAMAQPPLRSSPPASSPEHWHPAADKAPRVLSVNPDTSDEASDHRNPMADALGNLTRLVARASSNRQMARNQKSASPANPSRPRAGVATTAPDAVPDSQPVRRSQPHSYVLDIACGCRCWWDDPNPPPTVTCPKHGSVMVHGMRSADTSSGGPVGMATEGPDTPDLWA